MLLSCSLGPSPALSGALSRPCKAAQAKGLGCLRGSKEQHVAAFTRKTDAVKHRFVCRAEKSEEAGPGAATSVAEPASTGSGLIAAVAEDEGAWKWEDSEDATKAYGVFFAVLLAGSTPVWSHLPFGELPYFISLAVCTIYIGAHRGLTTTQRQQISLKEGALAPFAASASLFSLYLLLKYLPDLSIQSLLDVYFWFLGSFAIMGALGSPFRSAVGPLGEKTLKLNLPDWLLLDDKGEPITETEVAPWDLIAIALGIGLATAEVATHHTNFTLNNMVATLVASDILQLLGIRSFRGAGLLLMGLLAYDVFWVFGSPKVVGDNVMLAVATSDVITGPTRILFPKAFINGMSEAGNYPFSLLGLGDIAIPGLLACLALRYDASRSTDFSSRARDAWDAINAKIDELGPSASDEDVYVQTGDAAGAAFDAFADREAAQRDAAVSGSSDSEEAVGQAQRVTVSEAVLHQRTYFVPVMCAYVVGLVMAFAANDITGLGQPALLYLCPCTLLTVFGVAISRGELGRVWNFTDVASYGPFEELKRKEEEERAAKAAADGKDEGFSWPWEKKE